MGSKQPDRDSLAATLGKTLRAAREAAGLTQAQVAERASISNEFYARCERGRAVPATDTFARIVVALDVSADELLGLQVTPPALQDPLEEAPPELAQLAREIRALDPGMQRFLDRLLRYCEKRVPEE